MVEDRLTDPVRIAQLLSSELTGREDGPLGDLTVVDADREADPAPGGTVAYGVAVRDERVGDVVLFPDGVAISIAPRDPGAVVESVRGPGVTCERRTDVVPAVDERVRERDAVALRVEYGAAVKRAVDALVAGFDR